jgi:hypothetical protein
MALVQLSLLMDVGAEGLGQAPVPSPSPSTSCSASWHFDDWLWFAAAPECIVSILTLQILVVCAACSHRGVPWLSSPYIPS